MLRSWWKFLPAVIVASTLAVAVGCRRTTDSPAPAASSMPPQELTKGQGGGIRQIMFKIGKGPQALDNAVGKALESDSPSWDTLQMQATEYKQLTADLANLDPPRGTKDAWQKQTAAFTEAASALDRACQAKDLAAAKAAHDLLTNACMQCHNEHKRKGRGG